MFYKKSNVSSRLAAVLVVAGMVCAGSSHGADVDNGKRVFKECSACHQAGEGAQNAFGPVLNNIVGRKAGSYPGYSYSGDLSKAGEKGLVWTPDLLFEWLDDPSIFLKSYLGDNNAASNMPVTFPDKQRREDVIAYLATQTEADAKDDGVLMSHGETPFDAKLMPNHDARPDPVDKLQHVRQKLVAPPMLPMHSQKATGAPKVVEIELTVEEKQWVLDGDGTEIWALTYNGSIPAPAMVVHQGDYVELTLKNPSTNLLVHNIDLHAVTGALGGAAITTISPGNEVTIRFKATKSGSFLYHCAPEGSMTPYHVTHGMTGMILVLPREGLTDDKGQPLVYDKAFYIGENDFYVPRDDKGDYKQYSRPGEDLTDWIKSMRTLTPTHVVFNGRVGALTGKGAMTANVGENVLFLHMQANRDTRPHLIGGHGDYVWETGSFASPPLKDVQTWFVRGGSVGAMLYRFKQPGVYAYLNHNLIEAVEFGAAAHVVVKGKWDDDLLKKVSQGPVSE